MVVAEHFRGRGEEVTGWFFNPNIYPEEERRRREETLAEAAAAIDLPLLPSDNALGWPGFVLELARRGGRRCRGCYELRLEAAAKEAAAGGFDAFSSTLLISPYQDVEAIGEAGRVIGERAGVEFRFADLRDRYGESCDRSRELGLYRQNYCGCRFSQLERAERRLRRRKGFAGGGRGAGSAGRQGRGESGTAV
jgi:predicted adenine nucleotide alpha hydrolase (AANH) superfamily ATPase